MIGAKVDIPK